MASGQPMPYLLDATDEEIATFMHVLNQRNSKG